MKHDPKKPIYTFAQLNEGQLACRARGRHYWFWFPALGQSECHATHYYEVMPGMFQAMQTESERLAKLPK